MRWLVEKASSSFECDVIDPAYVEKVLTRSWGPVDLDDRDGGVLEQPEDGSRDGRPQDRRSVPSSNNGAPGRPPGFGLPPDHCCRSPAHCGRRRGVDHSGKRGAVFTVEPIDPVGYTRSGANGYPKTFVAAYHGRPLVAQCHIWSGRSHTTEFKLDGKGGVDAYQGFYFYRNDRLLQIGGWNQVFVADREHQLARVVIDIEDSWSDYLRMNPEKSSVATDASFSEAIGKARAEGGRTFAGYLDDAQDAYKKSRKRATRGRKQLRQARASIRRYGAHSTMSLSTCRTRNPSTSDEAAAGTSSSMSIASSESSG